MFEAGTNKPTRVRFCPQGHDKQIAGVTAYGTCRQCERIRTVIRTRQRRAKRRAMGLTAVPNRAEREATRGDGGGFRYAFHLPAAPLNAAVASYLRQQGPISDKTSTGAIFYRSPLHALAARYTQRFGGSDEAVLRFLSRLPKQTKVSIEQADRMAILIGLHPVMIWPREWGESA